MSKFYLGGMTHKENPIKILKFYLGRYIPLEEKVKHLSFEFSAWNFWKGTDKYLKIFYVIMNCEKNLKFLDYIGAQKLSCDQETLNFS